MKRFFDKVVKGPDCWQWVGCRTGKYGQISYLGEMIGAHRMSYIIHKGDVPEGMVVMHSCDTPLCVNPDHLSAGTYSDNQMDAVSKGRHTSQILSKAAHGEKMKRAWITRKERYGPSGIRG